jgi:hypothetical protein
MLVGSDDHAIPLAITENVLLPFEVYGIVTIDMVEFCVLNHTWLNAIQFHQLYILETSS